MKETAVTSSELVPELVPETVWRPWESVKAVQAVQTTSMKRTKVGGTPRTTFRPIAPMLPTESTSMPPPRLPTLKIRVTTVSPYRISSISSTTPKRPTPTRPAIPSPNSGFEPYRWMANDNWIIKPIQSRLHLIRQREADSEWAPTPSQTQIEKPPTMKE